MRTRNLSALVVLALALSGCAATTETAPTDGGKTPDTAPVATPTPTPTPTPSPTADAAESEYGERVVSRRGNLLKEVGQLAGTGSVSVDTGEELTTSRFAVTDLVLDFACDSGYADPPKNGHYLGIHLNVETTPELAHDDYPWISFNIYDWQAYDADGKRLNDPVGNAYMCLDSGTALPSEIGPGQSVSGWVVLDVAATTGAVALAMGGGPTGWEWEY